MIYKKTNFINMKKIYNFLKKINPKTELNRSMGSSSFFKSFMLTLAICIAGIGSLWGQAVSTYTPLITSGTYTVITGTTIVAAATDDGNSAATNIGFTFNLGGQNFTQFVANSNGHIRLGATAATSNYSPLSTTSNTYSISAAGRDGASQGGVIHTVSGSAPNRVSIIQYTGYRLVYNATTATVSFQIRLYETTNVVEIIYNGAVGNTTNRAAQVGIRGTTTAADTRNYSGTSSGWSALTAGNGSTTASWTSASMPSTASMPSNGRILRWSPPVVAACTGTPAPGNTITSSATVAPGGTVNLSLQNATTGTGLTYAWESGSSSTGPWTGFGTSSATQTSPAINANTWFRCRVICGANTGASNSVQVTLAACTPTAATDDGTGVTFVGFNTISNTSVGTPAYTNNTGISTSVFQNTAYPLTVRVNTAGAYTVNVLAWIDWNQNLTFEAGEQYNLGSANNVTDGNSTASPFSITVPGIALLGNTTMRVRATYNVAPTACGDQAYSEAEDYTINVQAIPLATCPTLTSPANATTGVSLTPTLTWTAGANTSSYDVYLSANQTDVNNQAVGARVSTSQAGTSYTSAALTPSATYYWRIVPKNSFGTEATGCTTFSFTTSAPSPTISQSGTLNDFSACQNVASAQQSFSVSGLYLTGNLVVTAPTDFSVSTTSGSGWASSVSLTPSSGTVSSTTIYVRMNALASNPTSGNIVCSSTSASSVNVAVSGSVIAAPTVNAGSDFALCSGQTVAMSGSTNATSSSGSSTSQSETGLSVAIPDADATGITRTRTISNSNINASQITSVSLAITHTWNSDLEIYLTSPSGVQIALSTGNGGSGDNYNCTFITGGTALPTGNSTVSGNVAPQTAFSTFTGSADGVWTLTVKDNGSGDLGTLTSWSINYTPTLIPSYAWSPSTGLSSTNVLNPNCSATTTTTYTLTVTGTNGCSATDQVVATVAGSAPSVPTASVSGSSTINVGGTTTLTSSAGASTLWYTAASGGSSIGSGDNWQTPVQCASGTITYYAEDNNGSCASASRTAVSFTVRPMVVSNPANGLICQAGGSVTLSAQLTGGSSITWSPNTNLSPTSGASTVASPTTTTVYTMNATVAGCGSVSGTQTVGVIDAVAFTPTSTPASVCAGNPAALASNLASAGFTYSSMPFAPSTAVSPTILCNACGVDDGSADNIAIPFTYNFFGNNYTTVNIGTNGVLQFGSSAGLGQYTYNSGNFPNVAYPANIIAAAAVDLNFTSGTLRVFTDGIAPTRKFVIEYLNVPGYSGGSNTVQIKLCETTGIVEIHVTNSSAFGGSSNRVVGLQDLTQTIGATAYSNTATITNTAWKFIPGANYTFQWATAGSNIGGATATTYTTPNLSTPGQVTYSVAATNPNTNCTTTQPVSITVNALPSAPNSSGDVTACSTAGNQSLTVSTGAGETADWFAASTGGTVLASGDNVLSYSTATANTYYAEAQNTTTGCSSATRTGVTLNVNTSPNAPTVTTPVSYCQGAPSIALTATATGANTLNWYSAAPSYPAVTGATALGSAPTPSTAASGTTNYYVSQSSSANSCESQLALVAVTVNATPSAPVASNPAAYCQSASASALTASATAGNTLYWYTHPTLNTGQTSIAPTPSTATAGTTDYYVADRTDASGCEGSRTTVTVTVSPTITASVSNSASSTSACGGGAITFTATPTNGGTPAYQWYLNASAVSGETNATYTLATPNDADVIYVEMTPSAQNCLASSAATASNTVTLTSTAATPTVSIQSTASTPICPGTSVTFTVNASANMGATPTYQWNLNGSSISGATNDTLVNTTLTNNDQVTLTMTSSLGGSCVTQQTATSSSITTNVNAATAISSQPTASAACLGGSQNFTVSATGTGALTYQWKKNGSNVTANATATTATLTLSGITGDAAADYTVDVTGTCGMVSSTTAALSINSATAISAQPTAVTQCAGTTANFSVTGSGQGTVSYQWRKDGSVLNGETNSTLAVANIATINAGQYSVIVTAGCGNVTSSNALLTVNSGTSISTQPAASTLCAGNTANFSVTASGTGALSYQWKKDGSNVGTSSSTLSVANSQAENAGTYTVDVTGTCGTITSNNTLLTVNPLTTISTQPVATAGCEGQNTTFTVVAAGTGALTYQWKFGGVNISGATAASFNIPSTTSADDGSYLVAVTGGCGTAVNSNTVALNVFASPSTALITTADITDGTLCGKNTVDVVANSPGAESTGSWSVVGGADITPANASATSTTFTAANSALGGAAKKLVWSHIRTTEGNNCYTRDTITVDFKQPLTTGTTASFTSDCYLWSGLTDANWSTSSNWYKHTGNNTSGRWEKVTNGEPGINSDVFILNNANDVCVNTLNVPTLGNGEVTNNVFNAQGAELNLSNGNLTLAGDFTNNGTINPGTGTLTFNGSSDQKIKGTGDIANLNNVIVNKSSGTLILEQPTRINGNLTISNGNIVTTNTNILEIGSSVSSTGSVTWTSGSIQGPIKRWFGNSTNSTQESGIFPVGTSTHNRNVIINFTSNSDGGYIIINFKSGLPTAVENPYNLPISYFVNGSTKYIQNADVTGYWEITPYNASGTAYGTMDNREYSISLRINNTGALIANPVTSNPPGMRILKAKGYSNGTHDPFTIANVNATVSSIGGSQTDFNVICTSLSGFSFFGMGGDNETPLPVELISFTGFCGENQTTINWKTASEFNSSYYVVEKSTDGENWREVNNQPAAGFSTEELSYQFIDESKNDNVYYRLSQFDTDGESTVYNPIFVSCDDNSNFIKTYPNPSDASFQVLVNNKSLIGKATIKMIDTKGTVVSIKEVQVEEGTNLFYLNEKMATGIYYITISNGNVSTEVVKHSVRYK
jgi:subtilisin-like proprotein convertase family protein